MVVGLPEAGRQVFVYLFIRLYFSGRLRIKSDLGPPHFFMLGNDYDVELHTIRDQTTNVTHSF